MEWTAKNVDWQARPNTREVILGLIIPILLLVPFLQYLAGPEMREVEKVGSELTLAEQQAGATRTLVRALELQLSQRKNTESSGDASHDRVARLLARSGTDRTARVATLISALADQQTLRGLTLRGVDVGKADERSGYAIIPLNFTLAGSYSAVIRYLVAVETIDQPLIVAGLDLTTEGGESFLVAKLNVEFYLPQ